jgi:hypothetical protein
MNVLLPYSTPVSAIYAYRTFTPHHAVATARGEETWQVVRDDLRRHHMDPRERARLMGLADLIHAHSASAIQIYTPDFVRKMVKGPPIYYEDDHSMKYPAAIVWDLDDMYWDVSPLNMSFHFWGWRGPDGEPLKDGEEIRMALDDGSDFQVWVDGRGLLKEGESVLPDGKDVFSIAANRERVAGLQKILRMVPMVTVSTPRLAAAVKEWAGVEATVVPNLVNRCDYPEIELGEPKKLRVLWRGGQSHFGDLQGIAEPLAEVLKRHPEVRMIFMGENFEAVTKRLPPEQVEHREWVPFEAYHLSLATVNHQISIVPLEDSRFNAGKSAIAWYENSALHKPAATLAAKVGPFADEIVDGETGMLYATGEEFAEKLEVLITQEQLRRGLAESARRWVWQERDAARWAGRLEEIFTEAVQRQARLTEDARCAVFQ